MGCRTTKKTTTEEKHTEKQLTAIKYDSVAISKGKTTKVEDKTELKVGEYSIKFKLDTSKVGWDSLWVKYPPKTALEALARLANQSTEVEAKGNINIDSKSSTTTTTETGDSTKITKEDNSQKIIEDSKKKVEKKTFGLSTGVIIWGVVIIALLALAIYFRIPFLSRIKKIFNG